MKFQSADKRSEVSYIMIKPDGVQRGLVGKIIGRFEEKGYKLIAMKMMRPTREQFEAHYGDLATRSFFPSLVAYMVRQSPLLLAWRCGVRLSVFFFFSLS